MHLAVGTTRIPTFPFSSILLSPHIPALLILGPSQHTTRYFCLGVWYGFSTKWIGVFPSGVPGISFL